MLSPEIVDKIISSTDLETLKWLHKIGKTCTEEAMDCSTINDHLFFYFLRKIK
jgi:hypothetical protein